MKVMEGWFCFLNKAKPIATEVGQALERAREGRFRRALEGEEQLCQEDCASTSAARQEDGNGRMDESATP